MAIEANQDLLVIGAIFALIIRPFGALLIVTIMSRTMYLSVSKELYTFLQSCPASNWSIIVLNIEDTPFATIYSTLPT